MWYILWRNALHFVAQYGAFCGAIWYIFDAMWYILNVFEMCHVSLNASFRLSLLYKFNFHSEHC